MEESEEEATIAYHNIADHSELATPLIANVTAEGHTCRDSDLAGNRQSATNQNLIIAKQKTFPNDATDLRAF